MERKQFRGGPPEMFVVYYHPRDYLGYFVVRRWMGGKPTEDFAIANTLEDARAEVPSDMLRVDRLSEDDAVIVETWI
jgi:hypothetical protein